SANSWRCRSPIPWMGSAPCAIAASYLRPMRSCNSLHHLCGVADYLVIFTLSAVKEKRLRLLCLLISLSSPSDFSETMHPTHHRSGNEDLHPRVGLHTRARR